MISQLEGQIKQDDFNALCDNINPRDNQSLTARNKTNRRVGYDINFHAPKSISTLYWAGYKKKKHLKPKSHI